jgi:methylenetetrahydrofolate reductase (NADPH)
MAASPSEDGRASGRPTSLRQLLAQPDAFVVAAELVTSRGLISTAHGRRTLGLARDLAAHPRIDALSITDNPGGHAMLAADTLGTDLLARGQEVIIHLSCKDWNRNALESRGWKLSSEGFENVLALSGDYPVGGYQGGARPVFDLDSVGLLRMYSDMNAGLGVPAGEQLGKTSFFLGAVVTNHKRLEREVMPQYFKLRKKIENGARFVITQIGYDARKDDELLRWLELGDLRVPVLANVYVLTPRAARAFNAGRIPGVVVTDELLRVAEREGGSADGGRSFFLDLAAKQVAVAKGLGFAGAYIGGRLEPREYDEILTRADAFAADDWRGFARDLCFGEPDEFYFFERDDSTGLSSTEVSRSYLASKRERKPDLRVPIRYRVARRTHELVFADDGALRPPVSAVVRAAERARTTRKTLHVLEQAAKVPLFGCRDCGDCSLPDIAYLCPESQCAKNQRNGPCGGTRDGKCEVGEKDCIWALAYERLKAYGEEESLAGGHAVVNDNSLRGTSAWANTFLGRDHHARDHHPSEGV